MKKLKYMVWSLCLIVATPFFTSCLDDNDDPAYGISSEMQLSTVRLLDNDQFYFEFDDGNTLYPNDGSVLRNYDAQDGQRVFVYYDLLEEKVDGYTYHGDIRLIQNILTKNIIPLTEETEDSIGDDRINAIEILIAGGYVNISFQYYGTHTEDKKHMLNLVQNETIEYPESDYIPLEFRHNAYNDYPSRIGWGYVCFNLETIEELMEQKKGFEIRINTINDGIIYQRIDLKKDSRSTWSASMHIDSSVNSSHSIK
ncbi:MAG: NigD-like protein [Bacteroides sp.]|nr:NigD-like protein [Bacteroides sp.]